MNEQIQQWQSSLPSADRDDLACTRGDGLAARLTLAACEVYQLTLKHLAGQIPKQSYRRFERSRDYLVLWSDGYGALSGDLDIVLSDSRRLRHATLGHLVSICRTLANKLGPLAHNQTETRINELAAEVRELAEAAAYTIRDQAKSDSDSDGDDSDVSSDNGDSRLEDVAGDLETEIGGSRWKAFHLLHVCEEDLYPNNIKLEATRSTRSPTLRVLLAGLQIQL
ncbi:hypothetical protein NKR23_g8598 [Pleurostoma richardsiae]|uniref:Uncharacterized protein n=1 Tax=Pleurostoma richardsiae TaxID=41990 RepID=A0AA38RI74_9PEZI|nr:hypothetical protein NKR23_g8598 [Pleurostoma richardsiae]